MQMANPYNLPELCYVWHESSDGSPVCVIKRGQVGYYPTDLDGEPKRMKALIDRQNERMGVSHAQREAMYAASVFGWHLPISNPEHHANAGPVAA